MTGANDVWAVGKQGTIVHGDGATWRLVPSGLTQEDLTGVWGASPDDVWAVGGRGTIVHVVAGAAQIVTAPSTDGLSAVWGAAADDVWAVGYRGAALHYDGKRWTASTIPDATDIALSALWGSGSDDVWALPYVTVDGTAPPLAHWDGHAWTRVPAPNGAGVPSLSGTGRDDVWAIVRDTTGDAMTPYHFDGHTWSAATTVPGTFNALWASAPNDVWAVGSTGALAHFDGTVWTALESPTHLSLMAVAGAPGGDAFAVGGSGVILRHAR